MNKQTTCKVLKMAQNRGALEALIELGLFCMVDDGTGKLVPALRVVIHEECVDACPQPEPVVCNLVIQDIAYDGEKWQIALTEDSKAPYLWLFGITGTAINLVTPTPEFPAALTSLELFNVADLSELIAVNPTSIAVAGTLTNTAPRPSVEPCSVGAIGFTVVAPESWASGDEFLLPTSLDGCEGAITYSVIYQGGVTGAIINGNVLTVNSEAKGVVLVNVYCSGLIAQTYIYSLPTPTTP